MMTQPVRSSIFVEASKKIYKFFDIHICVCIPHFFLIVHTMWLKPKKVHNYSSPLEIDPSKYAIVDFSQSF